MFAAAGKKNNRGNDSILGAKISSLIRFCLDAREQFLFARRGWGPMRGPLHAGCRWGKNGPRCRGEGTTDAAENINNRGNDSILAAGIPSLIRFLPLLAQREVGECRIFGALAGGFWLVRQLRRSRLGGHDFHYNSHLHKPRRRDARSQPCCVTAGMMTQGLWGVNGDLVLRVKL